MSRPADNSEMPALWERQGQPSRNSRDESVSEPFTHPAAFTAPQHAARAVPTPLAVLTPREIRNRAVAGIAR